MIGNSKVKKITKRELIEELRYGAINKLAIFEDVSSAQEAEQYIQQNNQFNHTIVVISQR